jgi:acyl-CoA reductase-like NAD-dependent aldehyde dehydrogenase
LIDRPDAPVDPQTHKLNQTNPTHPTATTAHVDQAVAAARAAFPYWSSLSGHERARFLDAIAEAVKRRKQEL